MVVVALLVSALFATLMMRGNIPFETKSIIGYSFLSVVIACALLYLPYRSELKAQRAHDAQVKAQNYETLFGTFAEDRIKANESMRKILGNVGAWVELILPPEKNLSQLQFSAHEVPDSKMRGTFTHPLLPHIRLDFYVIKFKKKNDSNAQEQVITFSQSALTRYPIENANYYCWGGGEGFLFDGLENQQGLTEKHLERIASLIQGTHDNYEVAS